MTFKGAIFDLDGVIVDTVPLHFEAWKHLFTDIHHIPFSKHDYENKVDGKPRIDGVRAILPNLTDEEAIKEGAIKQAYYLKLIKEGKLKKFPSSFALIKELKNHGILLAAASSSKNANFILEKIGLNKDFQAIISGNDFTHGKPHPEIFLNAAAKLNLTTNECVVFEDALVGVQAAKAGDFLCIGINRNHQDQNYINANLVVTDLAEVNYETLQKLYLTRPCK
jgi:beta-phosphoglucomutase